MVTQCSSNMWLILLLILVALVVIKLVNIHSFWTKLGVPYEPLPRYVFRALWRVHRNPILQLMRDDVKKYGNMYGSYNGPRPTLIVNDIEIAKTVLIKEFSNFFGRSFEFQTGDPLWDYGLTHRPYTQWKALRSIVGYSFTSSKMRGMVPRFERVAMRIVDKLKAIADSPNNEIDLKKYARGYSMDSMVATSFGIDMDSIENPDNEILLNASNLFKLTPATFVMMICPQLIKYLPGINFPPKRVSQFFKNMAKHIITQKRANLDEAIKNNCVDAIDLLLIAQRDDPENGKEITDEVLAAQTFTFFLAGGDTTTTTLQGCTYYLTTNPEVQDRVYEEIISVMGDRKSVTYEDIHKMKLVEACLLETLRLIPVSFAIDRICTQDTEVAGIPFKKGMGILFPLAAMQMDPRYFPEPESFMPQRFLKDGEIASETSAMLTFGDGPKGCVGRRLAIMNMQVILVHLLLNFRLEKCAATPPTLEMKCGLDFFADIARDPLIQRIVARQS